MGLSTAKSNTYTLVSGKKLPPDVRLKVTLAFGELIVKVPFRFENVALPARSRLDKARRSSS